MAYRIQYFGQSHASEREALDGEPLEFSSRRSAMAYAERHAPDHAEGFHLLRDGVRLRTIRLR